MPYSRPDYPQVYKDLDALAARLRDAQTAPEQAEIGRAHV